MGMENVYMILFPEVWFFTFILTLCLIHCKHSQCRRVRTPKGIVEVVITKSSELNDFTELDPSVSNSFSSSRGTPSVLTIEDVSNEASEPASARQEGVCEVLDVSVLALVTVPSELPTVSTDCTDPELEHIL